MCSSALGDQSDEENRERAVDNAYHWLPGPRGQAQGLLLSAKSATELAFDPSQSNASGQCCQHPVGTESSTFCACLVPIALVPSPEKGWTIIPPVGWRISPIGVRGICPV